MASEAIEILVVEDNPRYRNLLDEMLMTSDGAPSFEIVWADRLSTGLERLDTRDFDVALLDLMLSDSRGLATFRTIYEQAPELPIIVLSGLREEALAVKAVRAGAQDYLVKDQVNGSLLVRAIQYAIERKRSALRLRESEERFRGAYEDSPIGIAIYDADGELVQANQACLTIFGISKLGAIERLDLLSPSHLPREDREKQHEGETVRYETFFDVQELRDLGLPRSEASGRLYLEVFITPLDRADVGTSDRYLVHLQDTTKRKEAEEELESRSTYYRALLNSLHDQVLVVDDDYRITDINRTFLQRLERSREEVIGQRCFEAIHGAAEPCSGEHRRCPVRDVWDTGQAERAVHVHEEEGTLRWFEIVASPLYENGEVTGVVEAYRDVTAERRLEERLAGVNALGRELILTRDERKIAQIAVDAAMLLSRSPVCALWLLDEEGALTRWAHTHGAYVIELDSVALDDAEGVVSAAAREGESIYVPDVQEDPRYRTVDTSLEFHSVLCVPLKVKGRVLGVINAESDHVDAFDEVDQRLFATLADYTALALENTRLHQETTRRLTETRALQEVTRATASTLDFDEVLSRALQTIHRVLDIDALAFVLPDESRERLDLHPSFIVREPVLNEGWTIPVEGSVIGSAYTSGEPVLIPDVSENRHYVEWLDGARSEMAIPVKVDDTVAAILSAMDSNVSAFDEDDLRLFEAIAAQLGIVMKNAHLYEAEREQRKLLERSQAQLVQSEKLAATGRLTASLAHEINNPLQAIHNSLQLILAFPLEPEEQQEYLEMADEDVERLIDIVGRMLDFARKPQQEKKPTAVNDVIEKTLKLSNKYLQHSNIVLKKNLSSELPVVMATPGELQQVFLNLVLNAVDAMPDGGTLHVSSYLTDDSYLAVEFSDTGRGIPAEHLDQVFEPFFSTKDEGTGLGLSVSYNVVERHRGEIDVESELGEGSTFTVRLPVMPR